MMRCLVGFGSNSGDLQSWFDQAIVRLERHRKIQQLTYSRPVRTKAILGQSLVLESTSTDDGSHAGDFDDSNSASDYLNSVISFETSLSFQSLFALTREIETEFGRIRTGRWKARTVDLDILLFGDQIVETDQLMIPHPRMSFRRFVLQGAVEVAPEMRHPQSQVTLKALWKRICAGRRKVLWLVDHPKKLDQARRIRGWLNRASGCPLFHGDDRWEISILPLVSAEQIQRQRIKADDYSLLLYWSGEQNFLEVARWFGGPLLKLAYCKSSFFDREIVAAVEAMS